MFIPEDSFELIVYISTMAKFDTRPSANDSSGTMAGGSGTLKVDAKAVCVPIISIIRIYHSAERAIVSCPVSLRPFLSIQGRPRRDADALVRARRKPRGAAGFAPLSTRNRAFIRHGVK